MSSSNADGNQHQNIFGIADTAVQSLYTARKMFVVLIFTAMVFPPVLLGSIIISVDDVGTSPREAKLDSLIAQLRDGEISMEQFAQEFKNALSPSEFNNVQSSTEYKRDLPPSQYLYVLLIGIFVFWVGYGIKKWLEYGTLRKRYDSSNASRIKSKDKQDHASSHTDSGKMLDDEIFNIVNTLIRHLDREKKMIFVMTVVAVTLPFLLSGGFYVIVAEPIHASLAERSQILMAQLENNEISKEGFIQEYESITSSMIVGNGNFGPILYVLTLMLAFSIFWLGYGIRNWHMFTKWRKKYRESAALDEEINERLSGE